MHVADPILFSSLHYMITKAYLEFKPNQTSSFLEKWNSGTDKQANRNMMMMKQNNI